MRRRDALRSIAAGIALPALGALTPAELLALGRRVHASGEPGGRGRPQVLDARQRRTVAAAAERIIPETDTPGAAAAGVDRFVDTMLAGWYAPAERDRFLAGLSALDERARRAHGRAFAQCAPAQQTALLQARDEEVTALRRLPGARADEHWFAMLKFMTVWGYCTSQVGQTQVLGAYPFPGRYDPGCADG